MVIVKKKKKSKQKTQKTNQPPNNQSKTKHENQGLFCESHDKSTILMFPGLVKVVKK